MKILRILSVSIFMALVSCNSPRMKEEPKQETPKALEDNSSSLDIVSKRVSGDLVENLYQELEDKSPELKDLETQIDNLKKNESDSTETFRKYSSNNKSFYNSAENHIALMGDSVLRKKMKELITSSLTKYTSSISRQNDILKSIEKNNLILADLHIVLKIARTLPLIEKYQHDNLPSTKSMESFSRQLEQTIIYLDTLTKK